MNEPVPAWLFDGNVAVRRDVSVQVDRGAINIAGIESVDPIELEAVAHASARVFGRKGRPGWRLGFDVAPTGDLAAMLPSVSRYGGWIDRFGLAKAGVAFAVVSAIVVAVGLKAPDWIAPHISWDMERKIGRAMVGDLGGRFCKGQGGQEALTALVKRIDPGGIPVDVRVVNVPMVNAVALPGGTILIFDGLLRQADSPDEVAGVLGHEMGHVRKRHVMQALVRQAGLSVLLGGFSGNTGGNMNALLSASYSRGAEADADAYAIAALKRARVSPRETAAFFTKLGKGEEALGKAGAALGYVASHPVSSQRAAQFARSGVKGSHYIPALDHDRWRALADICHNDPSQKDKRSFNIFQ